MTDTDAPSEWTEVLLLVPRGWAELVSEVLSRPPLSTVAHGRPSLGTDAPPEGFEYLRSYAPTADDTPAWRSELGEALAALAGATGEPELANLTLRFRPLPAEDWANTWKKVWKPFRVGRLAVVPHLWRGTPKPRDVRLWLEPGAVFGTGRHATTRMCLAAVQERLAPGQRVLDAGTGTGLLAVAAALLGAEACVGFDIDPGSQRAAEALAVKNGVASRCQFRTGDFDVLTRAAIEAAGLTVQSDRRRGRWTTFIGVRDR